MKDTFIKALTDNVQRDGVQKLLEWLEKTDFYKAPASTKYHLSHEGGLVEHSLNVWRRLKNLANQPSNPQITEESITICGLLHDVCKANFYKIEMRNVKNEAGQWEKQPYYTVDDQLPYGHGEKSVYIISSFIKLTRDEAMAIRWHMGGFDESVKGGSYAINSAWQKHPLGVLLHSADLQATYIDEVKK